MKIDLQELKRLAGEAGEYGIVGLPTAYAQALVDVVEKALEYVDAHDNVVEARAHARLRAALTPFTESTNEEA